MSSSLCLGIAHDIQIFRYLHKVKELIGLIVSRDFSTDEYFLKAQVFIAANVDSG